MKICAINSVKSARHIKTIGDERLKEIEEASKSKNKLTGVNTGYSKTNRMTGGWQNSDLIIIGARPSMGKTSIALEFAISAAECGVNVDMYSLEMSDKQLYNKILSRKSGLENGFLRTSEVTSDHWTLIDLAHGKIEKLGIYVDDTAALKITDFRTKARMGKVKRNTGLIIIDYLQLMDGCLGKNSNREQEVATIARGIKSVAKELDTPIIALSQLSRSLESRSDKKPLLSDLRESGSVEQEADMVLFIYRPEYYNLLQDEKGESLINKIFLDCAKHRNGPLFEQVVYKNDNWTELSDNPNEIGKKSAIIENRYESRISEDDLTPNYVF
jgi:replicative DNA helicase